MDILTDLNAVLTVVNVPFEIGYFGEEPPDEFVVIIPQADEFIYGDNTPNMDIRKVRLGVFSKMHPYTLRDNIVKELLAADFYIADRKYIGFEFETKYHQMLVDVEKGYEMAV